MRLNLPPLKVAAQTIEAYRELDIRNSERRIIAKALRYEEDRYYGQSRDTGDNDYERAVLCGILADEIAPDTKEE